MKASFYAPLLFVVMSFGMLARADEKQSAHLGLTAQLLNDAAQFFGEPFAFESREQLSRFLNRAFTHSMSETEVRRSIFASAERFRATPHMHVSFVIEDAKMRVSFFRIRDQKPEFGGPERWDLSVTFFFDSAHQLRSSVESVSFGSYDGPVDDERKSEPNQSSEPTPTAGTPRAEPRVAPAAVAAHL